jgi:uncharacterized membrane protein
VIYALLAATLFAFVDIAWRRILPGVSIWRALFWRSLASSFLLLATALLWEDLSGLTAWSIQDAVHHLGWPVVTGVLGLVFFSLALQAAAAQLVVPIINLTGLFVWLWEWGWFCRVEQAVERRHGRVSLVQRGGRRPGRRALNPRLCAQWHRRCLDNTAKEGPPKEVAQHGAKFSNSEGREVEALPAVDCAVTKASHEGQCSLTWRA